MSEQLVRKIAIAALRGKTGDGGWLMIDAPKATDKEISLAVMEAAERGLVEACDASSFDSDYPEWRLIGPTGATERFIRETRIPKKVWAAVIAIGERVVAFVAWFIPILVGLMKK